MHSLRACCASLNTGKQLLGFYQVATRVADVFGVPMPDAVAKLLSTFELFNINIAGLGLPLQCIGLGAFEQQLAFTMLAPVVIATVLVLGFLIHHACRGRGYRTALLAALPWFLTLTFMVFPMVSRCAPAPPHLPHARPNVLKKRKRLQCCVSRVLMRGFRRRPFLSACGLCYLVRQQQAQACQEPCVGGHLSVPRWHLVRVHSLATACAPFHPGRAPHGALQGARVSHQ